MSSQLKISADTSEVKKSILDLGKSLKDLKGSKVQIFSSEDRKMLKGEFRKEIILMKSKLQDNKAEIKKMVQVQKELISGSKEELEQRKKILEAYKTQAKLSKQLGNAQSAVKSGGGIDQGGGGLLGGLTKFAKMIPGLAAAATIGYAITKGMAANAQYVAGSKSRNKLKGLGVDEDSFGSAEALARVGLSEQDMIQRRTEATSRLGREGTSNDGEMRKAGFERAFGLEGGTMTGVAGQLRGQMGGAGANDAQMKLQASVFAAGIEDAIGPYLESATQLLSAINENGATNTAEMTALFAQLTKDGTRTPEMMGKAFGGINDSVKGATGDQSAFLQSAFARAGIGGGTIGGTKFSMASGGIMGLDRGALEKRGYNKDLLGNMDQQGMFSGVGKRTGAILDMMKQQGGMKPGQSMSSITDPNQMVGMGNLASNTLGIKDPSQAFDALMMMEKVQNKQMDKKSFDAKMKSMQEGNDPSVARLDKINNTLSGQTEILRTIENTLLESMGKGTVVGANELQKMDNKGVDAMGKTVGGINSSGATSMVGRGLNSAADFVKGGGVLGMGISKAQDYFQNKSFQDGTSDEAIINQAKKRRDEGTGFKGMTDEQVESKVRASLAKQLTAKDIGTEVANALKSAPIVNRVKMPDGNVTERTTK